MHKNPVISIPRLFLFDKHNEPRLFTDPLGRHPQFPFLQRINGITTPEAFLHSIQDPKQRAKYNRTFPAFDLLLRNSGFANGYKDLSLKNIRKVYITPGTIGNLGFYDKEKNIINYLYVKLNPANESPDGIEAWKLTNKEGCYLYILFTCGNAFYPNGDAVVINGKPGAVVPVPSGGANNGNCCRTVTVKSSVAAVPQQKDSISRPAILRINYYRAYLTPPIKKTNLRYPVQLIKHKDTLVHFKDRLIIPARMDSASQYKVYNICRDSLVTMSFPLVGDPARKPIHPSRALYAV